MSISVHQQLHGYRSGHQLLQSSVRLDPKDQDLIDHLSDMAGPLRPGERFNVYMSGYPLPSQKYYALARTAQDLDAPRAGCVTTKTLLVPMAFWKNEASPAALVELLAGPAGGEPISVSIKAQAPTLAPVSSPSLPELVEALFLEERSAIVVFESPSPEEIALRLLTALWPGIRRNFSLCTFALSPRTLSGKSFDLLFAPQSARTRFSDWEGRRIEAPGKTGVERHRWTSHIVERIFYSPIPHLLDVDSIRALVSDADEGNAGILRLSLLWDELRGKAIESPTAVLGLIDIASSRGAVVPMWNILEPAIANAVTKASESMDTRSAWNFLTALLGKLSNGLHTDVINKALRFAGTRLTQRDWNSAFAYLAVEAPIEEESSGGLLQSIAVSLAAVDARQLTSALVSVSPERLLKVALLDDKLLTRIFSTTDALIDATLIQNLTQGLQFLTPEERSHQRRRFLLRVRGDQDSAFLVQLIADAKMAQLVEAVELVWGTSALRTPQLGGVFCNAAIANDSRHEVRTAFARLGDDDQTNRCIERLLTAESTDMKWLVENAEIGNRRTIFLNGLIEKSSPADLAQAFSSLQIATKALNLLAADLRQFASAAARIVALPGITAMDHVTLGLKIYPTLHGTERAMLAQSVANRVLTDGAVQGGDLPEQVIAAMSEDIDLPAAITIGLGTDLDGTQVSRTLVAFDRVPSAVRTLIEAHLDLIVELVASRPDFDLTADGAMAIARLIETAERLDRHTYVKICSMVLPFAVAARQKPASAIIIATFPTIYDGLRKDNDNFGLSKFLVFADWDKRKIARRDLVHAFMTSTWPPVDLAITALRVCKLRKILKQLLKQPGGSSYLAKVEEGTQHLEERLRKSVLKAIKEVRDSGSSVTDSEYHESAQ